jgi:ABC-type transporter Mla maintaining outer membrane lipid asymmetry ATPase subunit MlaF
MASADALVSVRALVKNHQALRPLRIQSLELRAGEVKSLAGLDAQAAEVMVGLLTGALLPDSGDVSLFGRSTRDIADSEAWLTMLDGVGIVTDRAVLIAQFSVAQNIAMPFTLEVDPIAAEVLPKVHALAAEVALPEHVLATRVAEVAGDVAARVRLARALALGPALLVAEHPSATLPRDAVHAYGADIARIAQARGLAVLAITADVALARALGGDVLTLDAATGALRSGGIWRKLFG